MGQKELQRFIKIEIKITRCKTHVRSDHFVRVGQNFFYQKGLCLVATMVLYDSSLRGIITFSRDRFLSICHATGTILEFHDFKTKEDSYMKAVHRTRIDNNVPK